MADYKNDRNTLVLNQALDKLNLRFPVAELARTLDYAKGNVSNFIKGKKPVPDNFLDNFFKAFDLNKSEFYIKTDSLLDPQPEYEVKKGTPYYDVEFTAGFLDVTNNQRQQPDSYISHPFFIGCDYVVRASGQSMSKIIKHGDAIGLIRIENWQDFLPFGEVYAIVTISGLRMVKIITEGKKPDSFTLISKPSDNKKDEFPPQQIPKNQIMHVFKVHASSHLF